MAVVKVVGGYLEVEMGGGGPVDPGYGVPAPPPSIWPSPGHPAHPIAPGGQPPGIWGGGNQPFPTPPIHYPPGGGGGGQPPGIWGGGNEGFPTPPIFIPPHVPPNLKPPQEPQPGDPTEPLPPPPGSGGWPTQPIEPPPYIVVMYPGVGPVVVAPPATSEPK